MSDELKVGTKVRLINDLYKTQVNYGLNGDMINLLNFEQLTIKDIEPYGSSYTLMFEEGGNVPYSYHKNDIEVIPEEDTVAASFWDEFYGISFDDGLTDEEPDEEVLPDVDIGVIITEDSVTLILDGAADIINIGEPNFEGVKELVLKGEYSQAQSLMNVAAGISNWGSGLLNIDNGEVSYADMTLTGKLVDKVIYMMTQGDKNFERFAKFLNLVQEQESYQTRNRLMDFVAAEEIQITEEGHVIAFKNVKSDYYDKHSGKFRNMVGDSPSMPRSQVDDDHNNTCSAGLHVCSPEYLRGFWGTSGKTMKVSVDPRDFVAIPHDYNDSKARVCKYTVVEDVSDKIEEYL